MAKKYKFNGTVTEEKSGCGGAVAAIILIVILLAICGSMGK